MKTEVLKLLKEYDGYLSGQEICQRLGVSRTAVWKVIKQLQSEGYQIEAVRNRGYHLTASTDVLTEAEIRSCIKGELMGCRVVCYEETDSTNTRARALAEEGAPEGTMTVAERQNAGKGRRGRSWSSPPGSGIFMSLVLRPDIPPSQASMVTLAAAVAVARGIRQATGVQAMIKWPNDLVLSGKKICGILTEMTTELESIQYAVVGIGINVNTEEFPQELSGTATSLFLETGSRWKRGPLVGEVAMAFEDCYRLFLASKDLSLLKEEYEQHLSNLNRQVTVLDPAGSYGGICRGITNDGQLLVEQEDGKVRQVLSGEVSVRGIYGYV